MNLPKPITKDLDYLPNPNLKPIPEQFRYGVPVNENEIHFEKVDTNGPSRLDAVNEQAKRFSFNLKGNDFGLDALVPTGDMFHLRGFRDGLENVISFSENNNFLNPKPNRFLDIAYGEMSEIAPKANYTGYQLTDINNNGVESFGDIAENNLMKEGLNNIGVSTRITDQENLILEHIARKQLASADISAENLTLKAQVSKDLKTNKGKKLLTNHVELEPRPNVYTKDIEYHKKSWMAGGLDDDITYEPITSGSTSKQANKKLEVLPALPKLTKEQDNQLRGKGKTQLEHLELAYKAEEVRNLAKKKALDKIQDATTISKENYIIDILEKVVKAQAQKRKELAKIPINTLSKNELVTRQNMLLGHKELKQRLDKRLAENKYSEEEKQYQKEKTNAILRERKQDTITAFVENKSATKLTNAIKKYASKKNKTAPIEEDEEDEDVIVKRILEQLAEKEKLVEKEKEKKESAKMNFEDNETNKTNETKMKIQREGLAVANEENNEKRLKQEEFEIRKYDYLVNKLETFLNRIEDRNAQRDVNKKIVRDNLGAGPILLKKGAQMTNEEKKQLAKILDVVAPNKFNGVGALKFVGSVLKKLRGQEIHNMQFDVVERKKALKKAREDLLAADKKVRFPPQKKAVIKTMKDLKEPKKEEPKKISNISTEQFQSDSDEEAYEEEYENYLKSQSSMDRARVKK